MKAYRNKMCRVISRLSLWPNDSGIVFLFPELSYVSQYRRRVLYVHMLETLLRYRPNDSRKKAAPSLGFVLYGRFSLACCILLLVSLIMFADLIADSPVSSILWLAAVLVPMFVAEPMWLRLCVFHKAREIVRTYLLNRSGSAMVCFTCGYRMTRRQSHGAQCPECGRDDSRMK